MTEQTPHPLSSLPGPDASPGRAGPGWLTPAVLFFLAGCVTPVGPEVFGIGAQVASAGRAIAGTAYQVDAVPVPVPVPGTPSCRGFC